MIHVRCVMTTAKRLQKSWISSLCPAVALKKAGGAVVAAGAAWLAYEVYDTYAMLSCIVRPEALELHAKRSDYIFIKDPSFSELFEMLEESDRARKKASVLWSKLPSPFSWVEWWRKTLAWRLLSLAQKGSWHERRRAVRALAQLGDLTDSDYRHLAQACDARTAVGLARTHGADHRFFLPPPYASANPSKQELIEYMRNLLLALQSMNQHPCVEYFLSKAFPEMQSWHLPFDVELLLDVHQPQHMTQDQLLTSCLENLLHHCSLPSNARDLVTVGALPLLMALYKHYHDSLEVKAMLCKILSYVSVHEDVLDQVYMSDTSAVFQFIVVKFAMSEVVRTVVSIQGWVGALAECSQSPATRLCLPAVRALANLDQDERLEGRYHPHVYLLHPARRQETSAPATVDVVFVHGLLGSVFVTWRQRDSALAPGPPGSQHAFVGREPELQPSDSRVTEYLQDATQADQDVWSDILKEYVVVMSDCPTGGNASANGPFHLRQGAGSLAEQMPGYTQCWPRDWLPQDCRGVRVLGINFDTALSFWAPICPVNQHMRHLDGRSEDLLEKVKLAGLGTRPIVWVAHSMGGLLVKNMLVKAWQSGDEVLERICRSSRAVVFYSVPHRGSPLAALRHTMQFLLWPSIEVQELRQDSPGLLSLHDRFLTLLSEVPLDVVSFTETQSTLVSRLNMQFNFVPRSSADPGVGEFYEIPQDHLCICKPANRHSFLYQRLLSVIQKHSR